MSHLFWVNWVANNTSGLASGSHNACISGYSTPYLCLDRAIEGAKFKEKQKEYVLVWIEEHDENGHMVSIPYLKRLVDAFGYRKRGLEDDGQG